MKKLSVVLVLACCAAAALAADLVSRTGAVKDAYNFWFYIPDSIAAWKKAPAAHAGAEPADSMVACLVDSIGHFIPSPKPLIVFLHGASLCGRNLDRVLTYGTIDAIEMGYKPDAYVLAPHNPGGAWSPKKIMKLIRWAQENYNIDSTRVYAIGMSLGGYGTLDLAAAYPDRIAAAVALCGGATASNLDALNAVPLWIMHGTADRAVAVAQSDRVVAAMRGGQGETPRLIFDRISGMNHSGLARVLYLPQTYDWLLAHSLLDVRRPVREAAYDPSSGVLSGAYRSYRGAVRPGFVKKTKKKKSSRRRRRR